MINYFWSLLIICFLTSMIVNAQDDNEKETKKEPYIFTDVINLDITSVKDQNRTGTCWSFSANSFFEQEMLRMGEKPVDLSEMFIVYNTYNAKAEKYVRMHGRLNFSSGGAFHDVLYVMKNYGIVPESVYSGLNYGEKKHIHGELNAILTSMINAVVANKNKKLSTSWKKAIQGVLDAYLGEIPESFSYQGKTYTPKTFLSKVCGINPDDYITISSFTHHPFYSQFVLEVPDNWLGQYVYNVPLNEMMTVIDQSLENGYSIAWASDVSEKGFLTKKLGIAIIPIEDTAVLGDAEIDKWEKMPKTDFEKKIYDYGKPLIEKEITQELRQEAFDNFQTTDDHGMHIYGLAVDQNGNKFYKVKNSWGEYNELKGYFYASVPFVAYKTTCVLVHKNAIPQEVKKKLGIH